MTKISKAILAGALGLVLTCSLNAVRADETCSSPYLARIEGQEEFVYVWTLGVEGMGDGSDKLVTVDVKPGSPNYGKVISIHLGWWPQRSAPRRFHRRPAPTLASWARKQPDVYFRCAH